MCCFWVIFQKSPWALGVLSTDLYFCAEISLYFSAFFVGGSARSDLSPGAGTLATLLILTLLIFWKLCNYMEFSKPGFTSSLSRKDEIIAAKSAFPQGRQVSLSAFFSHYMLGAGEEIREYHWLFVARVWPVAMIYEDGKRFM